MSDNLSEQHCVPCEGGVAPLTKEQASELVQQTPEWTLADDSKSISRHFTFKGFYKTMSFINMMAWIAQQQQHHPDVNFSYNTCTVTYTTHAIEGLSQNDFICASKIDAAV